MQIFPRMLPSHRPDFAPLWRLCVVILCLGSAIYIPLLASEPRRGSGARDAVAVILENPLSTGPIHSRFPGAKAEAASITSASVSMFK